MSKASAQAVVLVLAVMLVAVVLAGQGRAMAARFVNAQNTTTAVVTMEGQGK